MQPLSTMARNVNNTEFSNDEKSSNDEETRVAVCVASLRDALKTQNFVGEEEEASGWQGFSALKKRKTI